MCVCVCLCVCVYVYVAEAVIPEIEPEHNGNQQENSTVQGKNLKLEPKTCKPGTKTENLEPGSLVLET